MNNNIIYAYKKIDENKIVYVGQTVNLNNRDYRHKKIDPYDSTLKEYNYPLSRGIRKYGEDAYELIILENNLKREQLNEREKYWISLIGKNLISSLNSILKISFWIWDI